MPVSGFTNTPGVWVEVSIRWNRSGVVASCGACSDTLVLIGAVCTRRTQLVTPLVQSKIVNGVPVWAEKMLVKVQPLARKLSALWRQDVVFAPQQLVVLKTCGGTSQIRPTTTRLLMSVSAGPQSSLGSHGSRYPRLKLLNASLNVVLRSSICLASVKLAVSCKP